MNSAIMNGGGAYKMIEIKKIERGSIPISATLDRQMGDRQILQDGITLTQISSGNRTLRQNDRQMNDRSERQLVPIQPSAERYEPLRHTERQAERLDRPPQAPLGVSSERYDPIPNPQTQSLQSRNITEPPINGSVGGNGGGNGGEGGGQNWRVPPPPPSRDGTLRLEGTATPPRPSEESNGVALITPQEPELYTKEDEKWWWVCCLEFCFCLL
ncbi:uncharacterized protein LOC111706185 isoform X2 [Eurytemora carolleeae]|uniref:uncharacterized protein LOC111706185 isoform X2 n=1 Tax=Eurytemora carolleeae TaxID=1294199 RepID=UPI000C7798A2|nr:uncharacterized protein LOC111706185 isoform X2 [Eurytemora carolleeae]|eukprot:XP_023334754.1 uncharacterized protein LOC111706185 isoform X2 [Eurytemora affinis]